MPWAQAHGPASATALSGECTVHQHYLFHRAAAGPCQRRPAQLRLDKSYPPWLTLLAAQSDRGLWTVGLRGLRPRHRRCRPYGAKNRQLGWGAKKQMTQLCRANTASGEHEHDDDQAFSLHVKQAWVLQHREFGPVSHFRKIHCPHNQCKMATSNSTRPIIHSFLSGTIEDPRNCGVTIARIAPPKLR